MARALSLARLELLKNLCVGHSSSLRLRGTGLEASRAGAAVSLALPWLRLWRQWRRAEVTGAGGTGRKLVFWWRSCSQGRHAGGVLLCWFRAMGGTPPLDSAVGMVRDGFVPALYPLSPITGRFMERSGAYPAERRRNKARVPDNLWARGCANGAERRAALLVLGVSG